MKAHTGKRGSGCGSVSVDALRQLICFIEAKDAMLLGKKTDGAAARGSSIGNKWLVSPIF